MINHCSLGDKAIPSIDASSFLLPLGTNKASKERSVEIKEKIGIPQVGGIFWKRVWTMERRVENLAWAKTGVILPSEASEGNDKWGRERRIESETPVISLMVIWMERRVLLSKSFHISSVLSAYW